MSADYEAYVRALAATPLDEKTEHTDRSALERLLQAAADDAEPGARVQHEPRRDKGGAGSPDFKVIRAGRIRSRRPESKSKVERLLATKDEAAARQLFRLCSQDQWSYERAKEELPKLDLDGAMTELAYRPFDDRWTIWDRNVAVHRRERVMQHMRNGNIAIVTCHASTGEWQHVLVADKAVDNSYVSSRTKERGFVFPIYSSGAESFSPEFRAFLDNLYHHHYSPEEVLGYMYAVLHAPSYRRRYVEFLRVNFPRIPFPDARTNFDALSRLGWELAQAHLLKRVPIPSGGRLGEYCGKGDHAVEHVRYSPQEAAIWINKTQCFSPVPQEVWDFHIGGYKVLDKYLKSRKDRKLSLDEQTRIRDVTEALTFTIAQMARIDAAYRAVFPDGDKSAAPLASTAVSGDASRLIRYGPCHGPCAT